MCLIALAHRASERFPLILAANRDEDYDRASHDAHFWPDFPDILGGRDAVLGGTWLAITRQARFAAVTNLRGAVRRTKSRGFLVSDFVTRGVIPSDVHEYAGFH
ncbi:MAG TPA: NRDE family protein, partial [Thermoanaerobaculia bacterium]